MTWAQDVIDQAMIKVEDNKVPPLVDALMDAVACSDIDVYTAMVAAFIAADYDDPVLAQERHLESMGVAT